MQGRGFSSSHVFGVHIHRIHKFLDSGNIPVSTGFKQLPEGPVSAAVPAAAAPGVTATRAGRGAWAGVASFGGGSGRGASAAANPAAAAAGAAGCEGRRWGGAAGRGRRYLTVSHALRRRCTAGKQSGIFGRCWRRAGQCDGERGAAGRGGKQGI